jgi:hypothetical protein
MNGKFLCCSFNHHHHCMIITSRSFITIYYKIALDGDDGVLKDSAGRAVQRDIVQFVPYSQFAKQSIDRLSAAVLREIPGYTCHNVKYQILFFNFMFVANSQRT